MSTRRRFSGDFKAKVALEASRGDKTIQDHWTAGRGVIWRRIRYITLCNNVVTGARTASLEISVVD